ncbi:MAG: dipeptidyl aminopeptidase/acylaminoacyl peptidase [Parasphingorhabdus sp.]|jgi:dipeptidyl aminopeptidase/acylaminoacyl peptidase|uniref:hypothetical protein n=1 Tax=Parasphingorhabdus sp. TaxID=2709688 RepID=UPI0039E68370
MSKFQSRCKRSPLSFAVIGFMFLVNGAQAEEPKHLDVDAMLSIGVMGDSATLGWGGSATNLAHISPAGDMVAVVVTSGDPQNDAFKGQILIFNVAALLDETSLPRPEIVAEFSSRTNYQPIARLEWVDDNSLQFAAVDRDAAMQLYRLDIVTRKISQLTNETRPIVAFASADDIGGLLVVTEAGPPISPEDNPECLKQGCQVTARRLADAVSGAGKRGEYHGNLAYYDDVGSRRELTSLYSLDEIKQCVPNNFIPGGLSPNGQYALFFCTRSRWPNWWSEYTVNPRFSEMISSSNSNYAHQYVLLDIEANEIRPLNSAPYLRFAPYNDPLWINGGKRVLLVGAVEPLEGSSGSERLQRAGRLGVVSVNPSNGDTKFLFALDHEKFQRIAKARWNEEERVLIIEPIALDGTAAPEMAWHQNDEVWTRINTPMSKESPSPVQLHLVQSVNDRPILYATTEQDKLGREILDPNPWLDEYRLGFVEEIQWKSAEGHSWDGEVYYPPNYSKGRRYPLVILTHGDRLGSFSPNGFARNYAAQPLAARGMVVLQMNDRGVHDVFVSPAEWPRSREGIESAIDEMDHRGLIDRDRVGLVGWSRTSWYVNYMATHSDYQLKAIMQTDGGDLGWWTYIQAGVLDELEVDLGAVPFGKGLEPMLETSSAFSLDRWRAPLLMWSAGDVIDLWDIYAGLRRLEAPVEYWHFPDGTHDIFKMSHRRAGGELMVDWFDFWLNGHEDTKPGKADQYLRWRKLRDLEDRVLSTPRPPLLDWSATEVKRATK